MRRTATALLAACALTLAGCSSSGHSDKPSPAVTVTKTPKLSADAQKQACVEAWAKVLHDNADADQELDEPAECAGVSDHYGMYFDGMQQRNRENREAFDACTDDPTCTELPVP